MDIVHIEGATRVMGENQPEYQPLPLRDDFIPTADGRQKMHVMVSKWQPTPEEIAALSAGAPIFLSIISGNHMVDTPDFLCVLASKWPPVLLTVGEIPATNG